MAKHRNIRLKRSLVGSLIVFSIIVISGIALIFVNSTKRDTQHMEVIKWAGNVESSMLRARIMIDDIVLKGKYAELQSFAADLDTAGYFLQQLHSGMQSTIIDRLPASGSELTDRYTQISAVLADLKRMVSDPGKFGGARAADEVSAAFDELFFGYKAYESEIPGILLADNRRFTYQILVFVLINLFLLFIAGTIILRLANRLALADRELLRKAIDVESRERERIAADLHDGLGSLLSGLLIHIQAMERQHAGDDQLKEQLKQLNYLSNSAIRSIEEVINNLHPSSLSRYGLVESVSRLIRRINKLGRTQFNIRVTDADISFPRSTELFLFRICNELINNALKHSNATRANFVFYTERKKFHLVYSDDGVGFEMDNVSLDDEKSGLYNLVRRVESMDGKCWIKARPDHGVEIEIVLEVK